MIGWVDGVDFVVIKSGVDVVYFGIGVGYCLGWLCV